MEDSLDHLRQIGDAGQGTTTTASGTVAPTPGTAFPIPSSRLEAQAMDVPIPASSSPSSMAMETPAPVAPALVTPAPLARSSAAAMPTDAPPGRDSPIAMPSSPAAMSMEALCWQRTVPAPSSRRATTTRFSPELVPALATAGDLAQHTGHDRLPAADSLAGLDAATQDVAASMEDMAAPVEFVATPMEDVPPPTAIALARSLLPNNSSPSVQYNLPVLTVQRSDLEPEGNMPRVDWDSLQIVETHDEEGRFALLSENHMMRKV